MCVDKKLLSLFNEMLVQQPNMIFKMTKPACITSWLVLSYGIQEVFRCHVNVPIILNRRKIQKRYLSLIGRVHLPVTVMLTLLKN